MTDNVADEKIINDKRGACAPHECPVKISIDIIGGKWKSVILWHLVHKTLRFSQLQRRLIKITQKMLTQQLRELESDGIVHREVYAEVPPRVEYSLTEEGRTLEPVIRQMWEWGTEYRVRHPLEDQLSQTNCG